MAPISSSTDVAHVCFLASKEASHKQITANLFPKELFCCCLGFFGGFLFGFFFFFLQQNVEKFNHKGVLNNWKLWLKAIGRLIDSLEIQAKL